MSSRLQNTKIKLIKKRFSLNIDNNYVPLFGFKSSSPLCTYVTVHLCDRRPYVCMCQLSRE